MVLDLYLVLIFRGNVGCLINFLGVGVLEDSGGKVWYGWFLVGVTGSWEVFFSIFVRIFGIFCSV